MKHTPRPISKTADLSRGDKENVRQLLKAALSATIILALLWGAIWVLALATAHLIPPSAEAAVFRWGDVLGEDYASHEDYDKAQEIFAELLDQVELRDLPFALTIIEESTPNAFTVPGGRVFLTTGLLDLVESEEGIAFVLAHELGHQRYRHTLKRMSWSILSSIALALVGMQDGGSLETLVTLSSLSYSRGQEEEADAFAFSLIQQRYGDTKNALEFFEKIIETEGGRTNPWGSFLETHPATEKRVETLRKQSVH